MKIPRKIEWRAGVTLFGAATVLLGLLIALTLVRMDVGLEVSGIITPSQTGWIFHTKMPEERLSLLRRCKYIKLFKQNAYGQISDIQGDLAKQSGIHTKIQIQNLNIEAVPDTSQSLRAMLIETKKAPVLKVLFNSVFNQTRT